MKDIVFLPAERFTTVFYEKIGLVVFDRKIESIEDKEEALFLSNLTHLFGELERYTAFNEVNNETDEVAFNFELATSKGDFKSSRLTLVVPET